MSISSNGVKFLTRNKRNMIVIGLLGIVQAVLSMILYISFAANIIWPEKSSAAVGVANVLAYEGLLTDSSGNLLGGSSGTPYCFRFSIYDSASGGSKLWPAGTPATTTATTTSGVFSALIGVADALTYDFYDSDTVYLNVDVNNVSTTCSGSWESLTPRQRIAATGYSIAAQNVYGNLLRTNISSSIVQTGTGAGGPSPIYLGLDVKNTADYVGQSCSTNGLMWYNSATTQALICEAGKMQGLGTAATTTIGSLYDGTTVISSGQVYLSDANGVSFGINGNTITGSVSPGGGGAISQRWKELAIRISVSNVTNITAINGTPIFQPFFIDGTMTISRVNWEMSRATSGSNNFSVYAGIYSYANETQLSLLGSGGGAFSNTATASISGIRRFAINGFDVSTFAPGGYVLGMLFTGTATLSMNYSLRGGNTANMPVGGILEGTDSYNTATSYNFFPFFGRFTTSTAALPSTVADSAVRGQFTGASAALPWWVGLNND